LALAQAVIVRVRDWRENDPQTTLDYKDSFKPLKKIASELGVAHFIQGSVRKSGNRVKISVQLINGNNEQFLWQQTYDREIADVFAVQSDVAPQIADALRAQITPDVKERSHPHPKPGSVRSVFKRTERVFEFLVRY